MEKLLELAAKCCDHAEIYCKDSETRSVIFKNSRLHGIETQLQAGVSIRLIKDGKLGFAYTRNLHDPEELLQNAFNSLEAGVKADFTFPFTTNFKELKTMSESIKDVSSEDLINECSRICDLLATTSGEISAYSGISHEKVRIMNLAGSALSASNSCGTVYGSVGFPGSGASISRVSLGTEFKPISDEIIDEIKLMFTAANKTANVKSSRMKVLFMPNSAYSLNWRISAAVNAKNIYDKTSPLCSKFGEKIFSEKITVYDDPHDNSICLARAFDDEGTTTSRLPLFENGVLRNLFSDLNYAGKLNLKSSGHGFRTAQWCNDPVSLNPVPAATNLRYQTGNKSVAQLIASIDRGIILENCLGAHSGNILNGDLSLGGSPALYVENGVIQGRVDNIMIAGNIYDMFRNVVDLSNTAAAGFQSFTPAILIDDVKVASSS